jgi:hypothetical protein
MSPVLLLVDLKKDIEKRVLIMKERIRIGRQISAKHPPSAYNGVFTNIVLSRSHAEVWANDNGQVRHAHVSIEAGKLPAVVVSRVSTLPFIGPFSVLSFFSFCSLGVSDG